MDTKNSTNTPERFVVEPQSDMSSGLPAHSDQVQEQIISFLRTQGGGADLDLVAVLEAEGLAGLSAVQIQMLLQQSRQGAKVPKTIVAQNSTPGSEGVRSFV